MGFLTGKKFLITGISSNRSIAYGIAKACAREGAELALSYNNERFKERVQGFADEFGAGQVIKLDASSDESIDLAALELANRWTDGFDGFVHSIGWAPRDSISGSFLEGASREGFLSAMNVSVYSYIAMAKRMVPLMAGHKASLLTLSYLGGEKVVPNYNTMGLCKAALESATRYIAADVGPQGKAVSPTRSLVSIDEVGNTAAFLLSDNSLGITAETIYIDGGFNALACCVDQTASENA